MKKNQTAEANNPKFKLASSNFCPCCHKDRSKHFCNCDRKDYEYYLLDRDDYYDGHYDDYYYDDYDDDDYYDNRNDNNVVENMEDESLSYKKGRWRKVTGLEGKLDNNEIIGGYYFEECDCKEDESCKICNPEESEKPKTQKKQKKVNINYDPEEVLPSLTYNTEPPKGDLVSNNNNLKKIQKEERKNKPEEKRTKVEYPGCIKHSKYLFRHGGTVFYKGTKKQIVIKCSGVCCSRKFCKNDKKHQYGHVYHHPACMKDNGGKHNGVIEITCYEKLCYCGDKKEHPNHSKICSCGDKKPHFPHGKQSGCHCGEIHNDDYIELCTCDNKNYHTSKGPHFFKPLKTEDFYINQLPDGLPLGPREVKPKITKPPKLTKKQEVEKWRKELRKFMLGMFQYLKKGNQMPLEDSMIWAIIRDKFNKTNNDESLNDSFILEMKELIKESPFLSEKYVYFSNNKFMQTSDSTKTIKNDLKIQVEKWRRVFRLFMMFMADYRSEGNKIPEDDRNIWIHIKCTFENDGKSANYSSMLIIKKYVDGSSFLSKKYEEFEEKNRKKINEKMKVNMKSNDLIVESDTEIIPKDNNCNDDGED